MPTSTSLRLEKRWAKSEAARLDWKNEDYREADYVESEVKSS